jgi:hypothetical protein
MELVHYVLRVQSLDAYERSFGWKICDRDSDAVIRASTQSFSTRMEALMDSVEAVAPLTLDGRVSRLSKDTPGSVAFAP